ncbi:MAG: hypothetical protein U0T56_13000 [Ferruginibacter sp.]|jgi:hypothetical protein
MKSLKLLLFAALFSGSAAYAQEKPAAQGYIKDKPSNESQDRALKDLERQEKESSQPSEKPTPEPKDRETKERPEPADRERGGKND